MGNIWTLKQLPGFKRFYKLWRKVATNQQVEPSFNSPSPQRPCSVSFRINSLSSMEENPSVQYVQNNMHATAFKGWGLQQKFWWRWGSSWTPNPHQSTIGSHKTWSKVRHPLTQHVSKGALWDVLQLLRNSDDEEKGWVSLLLLLRQWPTSQFRWN